MVYDQNKLEEVRRKLSKLLALAGSPNENEANLAMERAAEIAAKYDIELGEIEIRDGKSQMVDMTVESLNSLPTYIDRWESVLLSVITNTFDCSAIVQNRPARWVFHILGRKPDVELAIHFYTFIRQTVASNGKSKFTKLKERSDYSLGMVATIKERLTDMYKKKSDIIQESGGMSLIVQKKKDAVDFRSKMFPNLTKGKQVNVRNADAYYKGVIDGGKVELNRPLK